MIHVFETGYLQDEEMEDEIMADFFETLENDMRKGADEIRKGWDAFKGSLKMAAFDLGHGVDQVGQGVGLAAHHKGEHSDEYRKCSK